MPKVKEIGGSIQDFLSMVRASFESQFPAKKTADGMMTRYTWVRDIFEDYIVVNDEETGQLYKVDMAKTLDGITFAPRNKWEKVKLTYASEMIGDTVITEFRGVPPEIPLRDGVDLTALTAGDDNPFFLALEISRAGRVSKNGLLHDEELANTLVQQINSQAAEGIMGHIKETDRSTSYPVSDVHWLGATRQGDTTWAKGYIPKTATAQREHFRILKATNGRAATSITGPAVREFVDKSKGTWRAKDFQLEQLDLAPFTRAALPPESDFVITREIYTQQQEPINMTREELLAELTAKDIPASVREQIMREVQEPVNARVHELETALAAGQTKTAALETAVAEFQTREFERALDARVSELVNWKVTSEEAKRKIEAFRKSLRSQIVNAVGDERDPQKVTEIIASVWEDIKPIAETVRDALAGPAAIVAAKVRGENSRTLDMSPEAIQASVSKFNVTV